MSSIIAGGTLELKYKMRAWKNVECGNDTPYMIKVCCKEFAKQEYSELTDDKWRTYDVEGNEMYKSGIKFCMFCGERLQ